MNDLINYKQKPVFDIFGDVFDILINDPFEGFHSSLLNQSTKVQYPYNIKVLDDSFQIDIAAIGLDKDDIEINIENNTLKVKSVKKDEKSKKENFVVKKMVNRNFELSWDFQADINLKKVEATLDKGLLSLKIPKKAKIIDKLKIAIK